MGPRAATPGRLGHRRRATGTHHRSRGRRAVRAGAEALGKAMTTTRKEHLDGVAVASLLLCTLLWGLGQVAAKVAVAELPPLSQAALRSLGAAVPVAALSRRRGNALLGSGGAPTHGLLLRPLSVSAHC